MANANVLELMAKYDFNSPIKATLLFEDSDDEVEILEENEKKEHSDTDNNVQDNKAYKEHVVTESLQSVTNTQIEIESKNSKESLRLNVTAKELQKNKPLVDISKQLNQNAQEKTSPNGDVEKTSSISIESGFQRDIVLDPSYRVNLNSTSEDRIKIRQNEEFVTHPDFTREPPYLLENLLDTLSEHLILVMHAFYRFGLNRNACDIIDYQKRKKTYTLIKHHFFELSYQTTISLIIPQEQNTSFISTFLENTVMLANTKFKKWKCGRGHIEPFFNEILTWTKNKRGLINRVSSVLIPDENYHLKQRLNKPLQTISKTFLDKSCSQNQNISNNVCLFSSGSLGVEINANSDTLISCYKNQSSPTVEWNGVQNKNPHNESYQIGSESRAMSQPCENQTNNYTKNNNYKHHRRLTPYSVIQNSISNENIEYPVHEIQARRHHNNTEKRRTQLQTNNQTNFISPFNSGTQNAGNYNMNNQMVGLQLRTGYESNTIQEPVISNVHTLQCTAHRTLEGRCCVCGKTTNIFCSKCNRHFYCSMLCQELHEQYNLQPIIPTQRIS